MKKLSLGIFLLALIVFFTTPSLARNQAEATPVQERNQARIQIQSESEGEEATSRGVLRSAERKSEVAKAVEVLLSAADRSGGIGPQIREIARAHNEGQNKAEEELAQSRAQARWRRLILGADYQALKEARKEIQQMQVRIEQLKRIQEKVQNQALAQQIQEAVQTLEREKAGLLEELNLEENQFSLFGWLRKLVLF